MGYARAVISRFAPSTTGEAHPGTLLSALLVWLDARHRGGTVLLRLEDLDRTRVKAAWSGQMVDALAWLGLDWDAVVVQSARSARHHAALDQLAAQGRLYPCTCSRTQRSGGRRAPDGGWAYPNTCRDRPLPAGGWRAAAAAATALRCRLPDDRVELVDDGGLDLSQTPACDLGDPIVVRRDGAIAYQLAVVVDDADAGITDVVRGRDIAPSTATQVLLQRLLGVAQPHYRHHFLLLEPRAATSSRSCTARSRGACCARATPSRASCAASSRAPRTSPAASRARRTTSSRSFAWARVPRDDRVARWGDALVIEPG